MGLSSVSYTRMSLQQHWQYPGRASVAYTRMCVRVSGADTRGPLPGRNVLHCPVAIPERGQRTSMGLLGLFPLRSMTWMQTIMNTFQFPSLTHQTIRPTLCSKLWPTFPPMTVALAKFLQQISMSSCNRCMNRCMVKNKKTEQWCPHICAL